MASKEEKIEVEGEVTEALPSTMFACSSTVANVLATISGKMRKHYIRILPGQGQGRAVAVRPDPRPHHLSPQNPMKVARQSSPCVSAAA